MGFIKRIKKSKWFRIGIVLIFLGLILGFIGIHFIAPYGVLKPFRHLSDLTPEQLNLKSKKVSIPANDNSNLEGYWINSNTDTTSCVMILIHGIAGNKESFLDLSKQLANIGIESVICDNRAHGESGGKFCTYGFEEKHDVQSIVDFIRKERPDVPIGVWGNSLGGAIAIQALEIEPRIRFGVIESTFTDFNKIVFDYKKRILKGCGIKFLSDYTVKRAGKIANFNPELVKPIESVKKIKQPVLIAHGNSDDNITVEYGKALFNNLASEDKVFVEVKDGEHEGLLTTGGKDYWDQLNEFIFRQL